MKCVLVGTILEVVKFTSSTIIAIGHIDERRYASTTPLQSNASVFQCRFKRTSAVSPAMNRYLSTFGENSFILQVSRWLRFLIFLSTIHKIPSRNSIYKDSLRPTEKRKGT